MMYPPTVRLSHVFLYALILAFLSVNTLAQERQAGEYRGTLEVVKFDVSPPLRSIPPVPIPDSLEQWGGLIVDPSGTDGEPRYGRQTPDQAMQSAPPTQEIPAPTLSFDAVTNLAGVSPPDPVGDIGPNHYVAMSNLFFEIYDRTGTSVFGPAANNTLWSGFGGQCESQNAGDPIVLYDQFADRWLLTQFTSSPEPGTGDHFNCVALSQTSDPTGAYFRWQISNGDPFPDYPKYGVGEEAYYISTRDFDPGYIGVGAFALNRAQLVAGNPNPTIISFFVDRTNPENVGDGLLPMDIDGFDLPPDSTRHYYIGSMDDGGPYGAAQDALTIWEFLVDFATPANSSFTLVATVPMSPYDTIFPCGGGRNCIAQPDTGNLVDHQGYRQRPLHRAAYRNFGTHQSIVTNQSVEADPGVSGIRWWEIRNPGASATIFQEGTYAPGNTDGIQRWFGSIAQDSAGNMALGYSASNATDVYPSVWYSGRLSTDAAGTMPQGEGVIVDGTGSQTGSQRWGDYTSMNVDPTDDCTFWYVNEYLPVTSGAGWRLRVGAFRFNECGDPGFSLSVSSATEVAICQADDATYDLNVGSIAMFDMPVTLSATGNPPPSSTSFVPNPVTPLPGSSTLTISNTDAVPAGDYNIEITGMATGASDRMVTVDLTVFDVIPGVPMLVSPADAAIDVPLNPTFEWMDNGAPEYVIEVAADAGFSNIVYTETTSNNQATPFDPLASSTTYFWRVRAQNACGPSADSEIRSFTTVSLPGDCPVGQVETVVHNFDFEAGAQGWTSGTNQGPNTWALSMANPNGGVQHWHTDDNSVPSDTFLTSPVLAIPAGLSSLTLRYFNAQAFEAPPSPTECWDGGILETSTDGGTNFTQVPDGDLLTDPYDGVLRTTSSNPLGGLLAWCETAQPYTDARVDISGLAGENNVVFRYRVGTDVTVGAPGWDIDDVKVVGCTSILEFEDGFETLVR